MSTKTIEQIERIDKRRYSLNLWRAIALLLFVGGGLARTFVPEETPFWGVFILFVYGIGAGLTIVVNGAFMGLVGKIRRDPELNEALNNEMFRHYTLRSALCGYYAMFIMGIVLGGVTWFRFGNVDIPGAVCCLAILFAGTLAQTIALLVYDRSR